MRTKLAATSPSTMQWKKFLEVKLNLTSRQLKTNVIDVVKIFNDFYLDRSIKFVLNANPSETNNNDVCQHKIPVKLSLNKSGF